MNIHFSPLEPTCLQCLSLDISPGGELGVVGGSDGQLTIFSTDDGSIQVYCEYGERKLNCSITFIL